MQATSGLVICAKQAATGAKLQRLIAKKETIKEYLALGTGTYALFDAITINMYEFRVGEH
jgi:23S rRNA-/tRNA-specific pseudouridylate synthase